jgi:hypothetical protein
MAASRIVPAQPRRGRLRSLERQPLVDTGYCGRGNMAESSELHPVAAESLHVSAAVGYFVTLKMASELAGRDPAACTRWVFEIVEPEIRRVTSVDEVLRALVLVQSTLKQPSSSALPELDQVAWSAWTCDFDYSTAPFYAHRAASRLAWAAMGLAAYTHDCRYQSRYLGGEIGGCKQGLEMVISQCACVLGMTFSDNEDGRLMVARSFSSVMREIA